MKPDEKKHFLKLVGAQIKKAREAKGISAAELARRTLTERSLIARLEAGNTNPTATTLKVVCDALEISFEELFRGFRPLPFQNS